MLQLLPALGNSSVLEPLAEGIHDQGVLIGPVMLL